MKSLFTMAPSPPHQAVQKDIKISLLSSYPPRQPTQFPSWNQAWRQIEMDLDKPISYGISEIAQALCPKGNIESTLKSWPNLLDSERVFPNTTQEWPSHGSFTVIKTKPSLSQAFYNLLDSASQEALGYSMQVTGLISSMFMPCSWAEDGTKALL